jgi:hypothetical protein
MPGTDASHVALGIALGKRSLGHKLGDIAPSQQGEVNLTTHASFLSDSPVGPEVLRGANVDRYELNSEPKQGTPLCLHVSKFLQDRRLDSKFFDHREIRIGYQRGSAIDNWRRIIACIVEPVNFCSDTINYIAKPQASLFFVLGLLNSRLFEWRFQLTSTTNHVNSYEVDSLPLRPVSFHTPTSEREQLLQQAKKLYEDYLQNQKWDSVLAFIGGCLHRSADGTPDTQHEKSDVVHDLLAFLAEEMVRLNKEKQAKIKEFLTWLEKEVLKGPVEDQKNKTRIKNFHDGTFEGLLDILKANNAVEDPCPSQTRATIEIEFDNTMAVLTPLKARIAATDSLIDRIVYELYGLSEEEIAIVEGKQSKGALSVAAPET